VRPEHVTGGEILVGAGQAGQVDAVARSQAQAATPRRLRPAKRRARGKRFAYDEGTIRGSGADGGENAQLRKRQTAMVIVLVMRR
jgi:hypothetical protein